MWNLTLHGKTRHEMKLCASAKQSALKGDYKHGETLPHTSSSLRQIRGKATGRRAIMRKKTEILKGSEVTALTACAFRGSSHQASAALTLPPCGGGGRDSLQGKTDLCVEHSRLSSHSTQRSTHIVIYCFRVCYISAPPPYPLSLVRVVISPPPCDVHSRE